MAKRIRLLSRPERKEPEYLMRLDPGIPLEDIELAVEKVRAHLRRRPTEFNFSVLVRRRTYRVSLDTK